MVEKFKTSWSLITHVTNSLSQRKVQGQKSPFADTIQLLVMCLHSLLFFFFSQLHSTHNFTFHTIRFYKEEVPFEQKLIGMKQEKLFEYVGKFIFKSVLSTRW